MPSKGAFGRCASTFLEDPDKNESYSEESNSEDDNIGNREEDSSSESEGSAEEELPKKEKIGQKKKNGNSKQKSETDSTDLWQTVSVTTRFCKSLEELSKNPSLNVVALNQNAKDIFESPGNKGKERSKNHIIRSVTLTAIKSEQLCTLSMNVSNINPKDANRSFANSGVGGHYVIFPKMERYDMQVPLTDPNANVDSPFIRQYPNRNLDNINEGIIHINESVSLIHMDHPVLGIFQQIQSNQGKGKELSSENQVVPNFFKADRKSTEDALKVVKEKMEEHLKITNLYDTKLTFNRAFPNSKSINNSGKKTTGSNWIDEEEIFDGVTTDRGKQQVIGTKNNVYITLEYRYRVV